MTDQAKVTIDDKQLQKGLDRLMSLTEGKKAVKKIFRSAANTLKKAVQDATPVSDVRRRPGKHLAKSYKLRAIRQGRGSNKKVGFRIIPGKRVDLGISADDKYYYPSILEKRHQIMSGPIEKMNQKLTSVVENELWNLIEATF